MTKFLLSTLFLSTSFIATAADYAPAGARYAAQGGVMTANANDTFALSVSPANLLSHGQESYSEFSVNFNHYKLPESQSNELKNNSDFQYIGGFYSGETFVFGGYMATEPEHLYVQSLKTNEWNKVDVDLLGLAIAWGSSNIDGSNAFDWGIGGSLDEITATDHKKAKLSSLDSDYTLSGKVSYHSSYIFQNRAIDIIFKMAASNSSEVISDSQKHQRLVIRPKTTRIGVSALFAHSGELINWDLNLSSEFVSKSTSLIEQESPNNTISEDEIRIGAEFILVQPFGYQMDIAIRSGVVKLDETNETLLSSAGIGFSGKKWSVDLSAQESEINADDKHYDLSISYKL
jgi:hypothetical protein